MMRKLLKLGFLPLGLTVCSSALELLPERWFEDVPASDTSVQRSYVFRSVPGVVYQIETSPDLSTWTSGSEIYGLGHEHVIPLIEVAAPPPSPAPDPSIPPVSFVPYSSVSLKIQPATGAAGGIVLSWPSLDHGGPMIHRVDGTLHQGWDEALLFTERYDNFYFFIHHPYDPTHHHSRIRPSVPTIRKW